MSARSVHNHFVDVEALRAEVAQRQWERCAPYAGALDRSGPVPSGSTSSSPSEPRSTRRSRPFAAPRCCRSHDSPTIAANLARLDRALRRQIERRVPTSTPTRSTRSTRPRRGMRGTVCDARRVAASPGPAGFSPARSSSLDRRSRVDERDQTQQGAVHRADGSSRRGTGRDAQPVEVQEQAEGSEGSGASEYGKYSDAAVQMVEARGGKVLWMGRADQILIGDPDAKTGTPSRSCSTRAARTSSRWFPRPSTRRRTSTASRVSNARC